MGNMKHVIIIGSGISGLSAAIYAAKNGMKVQLLSSDLPERSQSVLAAGGMNAYDKNSDDTVELHIQDTLKSAQEMADPKAIEALCHDANDILDDLCKFGVLFNREDNGKVSRRAFGGQSKNRTAYAGTSTGKQIVTGLVRTLRKYEKEGLVEFLPARFFIKALIHDKKAYGVLVYNDCTHSLESHFADYVIIATGGQNALYGKTTGSVLCDASAVANLFEQGVQLKNLEFIQFHPTTVFANGKHLLISEAARGEGGRLFYYGDDGSKIYFLEDKYGEKGNLLTRDLISQEMFNLKKPVYLDISFLPKDVIDKKLEEVKSLCETYLGLDVTKSPIPVEPSVHFFMGGIDVDINHKTNIDGLYAIGECACAYHGANRLGGNSLLAAVHSAKAAVAGICNDDNKSNDLSKDFFDGLINQENDKIHHASSQFNDYLSADIQLAIIMNSYVGIVRSEDSLNTAITAIDSLEKQLEMQQEASDVITQFQLKNYGLKQVIKLAKAVVLSAQNRKESRGSHFRSDYPQINPEYAKPSIARCSEGKISIGE